MPCGASASFNGKVVLQTLTILEQGHAIHSRKLYSTCETTAVMSLSPGWDRASEKWTGWLDLVSVLGHSSRNMHGSKSMVSLSPRLIQLLLMWNVWSTCNRDQSWVPEMASALKETNQPLGSNQITAGPLHLGKGNVLSLPELTCTPWVCLSCLQSPGQHHYLRAHRVTNLLTWDLD